MTIAPARIRKSPCAQRDRTGLEYRLGYNANHGTIHAIALPTYVSVKGILSDENGDYIPCALVILSEKKRMGIHNLGLKQNASFSLLSFDSEYGANGMYALGIDAHSTDRRV